MLHHVEVYVSDLERSFEFWSWLLAKLDYQVSAKWDDGFSLKGAGAYLTFVQVDSKFSDRSFHRRGVGMNHLAFAVADRPTVDSLRQQLKDRGVPLLYDEKYPFANGGTDFYALYLEDPDRIKVEFVALGR